MLLLDLAKKAWQTSEELFEAHDKKSLTNWKNKRKYN